MTDAERIRDEHRKRLWFMAYTDYGSHIPPADRAACCSDIMEIESLRADVRRLKGDGGKTITGTASTVIFNLLAFAGIVAVCHHAIRMFQ